MTSANGDRLAGVRAELAARLRDPESEGRSPPAMVCQACVRLLPIDGASLAIGANPDTREMLYASDETAARIEALQDNLGEGPSLAASAHRRPVLVPEMVAGAAPAWPVFADEIASHPVGAVFAFPLLCGASAVAPAAGRSQTNYEIAFVCGLSHSVRVGGRPLAPSVA